MQTETTFTERLECVLTPDEWTEKAKLMAETRLAYERVEAEKKRVVDSFSGQLKHLNNTISETTQILHSGREWRQVECRKYPHFDRGEWEIVRLDTFETVRTEPMTNRDRQAEMPFEAPQPEPATAEPAPAETEAEAEAETETSQGGTPTRTLLTAEELDSAAWRWATSPLGGGEKFSLFYLDGNPYVITNVLYGEKTAEGHQPVASIQAWSVLPVEIVGKDNVREAYSEETGWLYVGVPVGKEIWVMVHQNPLWTLAPTEKPAVEMADDISTSPKDLALYHALHHFEGARGRWEDFRAKGDFSDTALNAAISQEFGLAGGMEIGGVSFAFKGGDVCKFWFGKVAPKGTPTWQGKSLLENARRILNLPKAAKTATTARRAASPRPPAASATA